MSTNVPKISVTAEAHNSNSYEHHHTSSSSNSEDNSDSFSNDMDYNQNLGGVTDVEDMDSYADIERPRSRRSSKNSVAVTKGLPDNQGDVTDVEDYNDSELGEEDETSVVYPELKLSLREFLQHDIQEQLSTSNGLKEMVEHKSGNFLQAQNLNTLNDYLTDCEDYNTESEIENECEKSVCVDLNETFVEQGRVSIADTTVNTKDHEDSDYDYDEISVVSDISDMASAISDVTGKDIHGMSEDEVMELSGNEEICQISCSDSESVSNQGNVSEEDLLSSASMAPLDVAFVHTTNRSKLINDPFVQGAVPKGGFSKKMFLEVKENKKEDVLTDIERFDDSVAEGDDDDDSFDGDDDQQPIPQAVIIATGDEGGCVTDCEDLFCDDMSETAAFKAHSVDINVIPLPQREIVMLQEDKFGDTITSVMPMDKEYQFGMYAVVKDDCVTDTEEFSCADDLDIQGFGPDLIPSPSPSPSPSNVIVESDVTVANELFKTQQSKRLEIISNAESVTDVEEIYMAGTNSRKKKLKTRTQSKSKSKYLETPKPTTREDGGGTDIEDMDLSESGLSVGAFKCVKKSEPNRQSYHSHSDKVTDVEDMTADDVSDAELPPIDTNTTNFKDYESSSKNIVVTLETCGSATCAKHNSRKRANNAHVLRETCQNTHQNQQQQQTDVEDVQFPSDAEECLNNSEPSVDCVCNELSEMLNESCTTVHEKCSNSFNVDAEKLHIKGMLRESHTDIEYVESDESAARGSK